MWFERAPDPRCQRGLTFIYTAPGLDVERLLASLDASFDGQLVKAEECFGGKAQHRRVLQFRFELRVVAYTDRFRLMHRVSASADLRAEDRDRVEGVLEAL